MYSVTRTIGLPTTMRANASIQADTGEPWYACDIKSAVIGNGWETHLARAARLFLDAETATYDNPMLMLKNPRLIFAMETGSLTQASTPPGTDTTIITSPDLVVSRLDTLDEIAAVSLEFRMEEIALAAGTGATMDFNRVYLVANSAIVDYNMAPILGASGVTEPGVTHINAADDQTFDDATDLYVLTGAAGTVVVDASAYEIWIDRTEIVTDPVWNADVVMGAVDIRNTALDEIEVDILRGSATAAASVTMRVII